MFWVNWFGRIVFIPSIRHCLDTNIHTFSLVLFIFLGKIVMEISWKLSDHATGNACSGSLLCNLRLSAWPGTIVARES